LVKPQDKDRGGGEDKNKKGKKLLLTSSKRKTVCGQPQKGDVKPLELVLGEKGPGIQSAKKRQEAWALQKKKRGSGLPCRPEERPTKRCTVEKLSSDPRLARRPPEGGGCQKL